MYDVIVIGAGPAGLSAGIYTIRSGLKAIIVERGVSGGQAAEAPVIENYPGFQSIAGMELMEKMKDHCSKYCGIKENERVVNITNPLKDGFLIETERERYKSRAVIIATGAKHRKLNIRGENEFLGKGVSYCATCDGFFFKNKKVVVVGGGNTAIADAIYLKSVGANVKVVHRRNELRADRALQDSMFSKGVEAIFNSQVKEIKGGRKVEKISLSNGEEIACDGVFISIGEEPNNELAKLLGLKMDEKGYVKTGENQRTNKKFVYAAGDIAAGMKQVVVDCAQGATAASSAYIDLQNPYWAH